MSGSAPQRQRSMLVRKVSLSCQAKANRGILYVDEVNLLDDGLVDVVLDSAASGVNTVEREGISIAHPARFIMIGSGNPSEVPAPPVLWYGHSCESGHNTIVSAE